MTAQPTPSLDVARFERVYDAPAGLIWELWTTAAGLGEWFAPDGFESRVSELDLRAGGQLCYTMTATAPEQIAFLRDTGNPLSVEVRKTFTEVVPSARLAYLSLIDFVPGREPYEHLTIVDIEPDGDRTKVVMTLDPLHDETWTRQHRAHRGNELDNLDAAIRRRRTGRDYHADLTISAPLDAVFVAVSSVEGLSGWWTTAASGSPEPGGELRFAFRDGVAVMRVEDRTPTLERWTCLGHSGQPEWAGTTVTFRLTETSRATTRLQFTHGGLRPELDCYGHCSAGWNYLMSSLAAYAETGTGSPVSP
ncbi:MAG TPA: SRPBCC family protein [Trebonia sp.]|nr:SRPBCC family protein [Trebonia sp.]